MPEILKTMSETLQARLHKMRVNQASEVQYFIEGEAGEIFLNEKIGKPLRFVFDGEITCTECDRQIKKTYQGMCYQCFSTAASASECIIHPELCEAHLGKGRDPEWEERNHNKPHIVYLALSGGVKVGVTRETQVPVRWIDQGAAKTIILAETPYRQLAGAIEVELKQFVSDKTDWRMMLKNHLPDVDLLAEKKEFSELLSRNLMPYISKNDTVFEFKYPVLDYPVKVTSLKLDSISDFEHRLTGIKGQYLIFENGLVFNVRNHSGYHVRIEA